MLSKRLILLTLAVCLLAACATDTIINPMTLQTGLNQICPEWAGYVDSRCDVAVWNFSLGGGTADVFLTNFDAIRITVVNSAFLINTGENILVRNDYGDYFNHETTRFPAGTYIVTRSDPDHVAKFKISNTDTTVLMSIIGELVREHPSEAAGEP